MGLLTHKFAWMKGAARVIAVDHVVVHYIPELYEKVANGSFDPTDIITHRLPLSEAEHGYQVFDGKMENCIKVVLKPQLLH